MKLNNFKKNNRNIFTPSYIRELKPYKATPQDPWLFTKKSQIAKVDWNEGSFIPLRVKFKIFSLLFKNHFLNWYPDSTSFELIKSISEFTKIDINQILTFSGADDALDKICRTFLREDDNVLLLDPTYDNFEIYAKSCGAKILKIKIFNQRELKIDKIIRFSKKNKIKMIYISNPNNPIGYTIPKNQIYKLCKHLKQTLILCDQAYAEFSNKSDCKSLIKENHNLLITRSFSKAFAIAGLRLGYVLSNFNNIQNLAKVRNGKNVSMIGQVVATEILKNVDLYKTWINEIQNEKYKIYQNLKKLKIKYFKSEANFILIYVKYPKVLLLNLRKNMIFARDKISTTNGGIRLTVSNKKNNLKFLNVLKKYLNEFE